MVFKNPVKPVTIEIAPRGTPCGFSKSRHKKMAKKKQATQITEEDFSNIGYGLGRMIRVFKDGFDRGINEKLNLNRGGGEDDIHQAESANGKSVQNHSSNL